MPDGSTHHERELREQWQREHLEQHKLEAKALTLARGTIDLKTLFASITAAGVVAGIIVRLMGK